MTLFAHDPGSSPERDIEPAGGRRASARGEVSRPPVDRVVADGPIERLLLSISARILKASHEELEAVVRDCLRQVLEALQMDRGALCKVEQECSRVIVSHKWYAPGAELLLERVNLAEQMPWSYEQLVVQGRTLIKTGVESMPPEATLDRAAFVRLNIKTALAMPLSLDGRVHHILVVHATRKPVLLPLPLVPQLRLLGEILVNAIERRDMLNALSISQQRLDMAAASARVGLWELDLETRIFWATPIALAHFQFSEDQPITLDDVLAQVHPEDRGLIAASIKRARDLDQEVQVEYRVPQHDGRDRWMISRGRIRQDRNTARIFLTGVTSETTARKEMEQRLRQQVREINSLREQLEQENIVLRAEAGLDEEPHRALGISPAMQRVQAMIEQVAATGSTVLILGETGTGKELVAQAIHQRSDRGKRLMITVNCAALPAALIESELFGREKGAFTGALSRQAGRFELAHDSTLFLDEIAEMPVETQSKLLRVLQDGTFERLGSPVNLKTDVRIIAATNRNLEEEVEQGRFRRDLFYRLNVFPIVVPPLRERVEDIAMLVWRFVSEFGQSMGRKISKIARDDMARMEAYDWPGNVRELRNVIERAMITSTGTVLDLSQLALPSPIHSQPPATMTLEEIERRHIRATLKATRGKIKGRGGAAELLGLNPSTLYSRMRKLAIRVETD
jgi:PAS domain S-box-containing protein